MNYKVLKRLCDEQKRQIEMWKRYCEREERLLRDAYSLLECQIDDASATMYQIKLFLEENNVR